MCTYIECITNRAHAPFTSPFTPPPFTSIEVNSSNTPSWTLSSLGQYKHQFLYHCFLLLFIYQAPSLVALRLFFFPQLHATLETSSFLFVALSISGQ